MRTDFLAQVDLFAGMPRADLERLCGMIHTVNLGRGEVLFAEGSAGDVAYIIESGELEVVKQSGPREVLLAVRRSGEVIGEMALLEEAPRMATVRARSPARLHAIAQAQITELIQTSAGAARAMFYTVLARWRSTGVLLRQSEKMAQLGTLTAGVAHELNNPAAAVKRGADHLRAALGQRDLAQRALASAGLDVAQWAVIDALAAEIGARAGRPASLDALARADLEAEVEDWLDDRGVSQGWELAPQLVDLGLDVARLDQLAEGVAAAAIDPAIRFVGAAHAVDSVLLEISQGAERLSSIVGALKQYSFLDQAPVQAVDLHEGLDNTLVILGHKLKKGIEVVRQYADDLPTIEARGSELNQVWTNLIDNAADALGGEGRITLTTRRDGDWVMVDVEDNGPGIPSDIVGKVFDPFFTTKAPGKGTGQGLDIAYRIVANGHRGTIKANSRPGHTCFRVTLPLHPDVIGASAPSPQSNEDAQRQILSLSNRVAVVGLSSNPQRPAHTVPKYLHKHGFDIVPVNPKPGQFQGIDHVPSLAEVQGDVDTVLIFRRSEDVPAIVEQAIAMGAKAVWMQLGIVSDEGTEAASAAGLLVVSDVCMYAAHKRWGKGD